MLKKEIVYGQKVITYELKFSDRKNLQIDVNPDKSVVVTAPSGSGLDKIDEKVRKRGRWILNQQKYFNQFPPLQPKRQYLSGESYRYLGRQYRLKICFGKEHVTLHSGRLSVWTLSKTDPEKIKAQINSWQRARSEIIFNQELDKLSSVLNRLEVERPKIKIRRMKTRWGSCHKDGTISLNPELVKENREAILYVLTHELCHLKEFTHSPKFYALLDRMMPDWRQVKQKLDSVVVRSE